MQALLKEKDCELVIDAAAKEWLATTGYNPAYGARPLNRIIQRTVLNPMSKLFLGGNISEGEKVHVTVEQLAGAAGGGDTTTPPPSIDASNVDQYRLVVRPNHAGDVADGSDGAGAASVSRDSFLDDTEGVTHTSFASREEGVDEDESPLKPETTA